MERKCLDCGETLVGRIDKKFCSDMCRNSYNNRLNTESADLVRKVNTILRKNRRILAGLIPVDKVTVHKDKLVNMGFNFSYFTSIYTTQKGATYKFCYEYGYLPIENDFIMLVLRGKKGESQKD